MRFSPRWRAGVGALGALCLLASIGPAVARPAGVLPEVGEVADEVTEPLVWGDFAPAFPGDIVVSQPDGSRFKAQLTGGEIGGNLEVDGYTVTKDTDGWWVYATGRDGRSLVASAARVGLDQRPADLAVGIGRIPNIWSDGKGGDLRTQALRQLQIASAQAAAAAAEEGGPRVFRFPVLMLATWWDEEAGQTEPQFQAESTPEAIKELLDGFGGNDTGTLTEFYFENSYGQFLVQVDVFGPFTSQRSRQDRCYYGGIDASDDPIDDLDPLDNALPGGGGALGMAVEAVPQADATVNFADYDNDGDGFVDFTALLHSGPDMAATGDPCHTWSHAIEAGLAGSVVEGAAGIPPGTLEHGIPTTDGVLVNRLFTMPEIDLEIGVAVHEMAHALGEPDYYNPDYTSMGTGDWDIMAGGSWFGNPPGSNPTGFQPASKIFQGWITPTIVKDDVRDLRLAPRNLKPAGYTAASPHPNIVLVPIKTIAVGETDELGHTWTETDVYGLAKDGDRYVIEGYFLENWSRSVLAPKIDPRMPRGSMFDRQALASGLMVWHFDYFTQSNVYYGANDAGTDPNRPQMDPVEWDYNDNSQELQLGMTRGEPQDLVQAGAATGITSGTRLAPGATRPPRGEPQPASEVSGTDDLSTAQDHSFTVEDRPANELLRVSVTGTGDCTIELLKDGESVVFVDEGFLGATEVAEVRRPEPGEWTLRVDNLSAPPEVYPCGDYEGTIELLRADATYDTKGAGDTWSNWTEKPTGWAFTNVRPTAGEGVDTVLDAGDGVLTVDVLRLDGGDTDVSPGYVGPFDLTVGGPNRVEVPVFNNGGTNQPKVGVTVRRGSATGPVVASGSIAVPPYSRELFGFDFTPQAEGTDALVVTVDPAGAISEVSEANNTQRSIVEVSPAGGRVLVVDDDGAGDAQDSVTGPLSVLGITFDVVRPPVSLDLLKRYQAVVWEAGLERYQGQLSADDRAVVAAYLDGGGRLLYMSPRAASAIGEPAGSTNPLQAEDAPAFLASYFGARWIDTQQVGGGRVTGTGDIIGKDAFDTTVMAGRPLQDVFGAAESPVGTVVPVATWEKGGEDSLMGVRVQGDAKHNGFRSVFFGFNPSQVLSADMTVSVIERALGHLGVSPASYPGPARTVLRHTSVRQAIAGTDVQVIAFTKGGGSMRPTLSYRRHGDPKLFSVAMTAGRLPGTWQATIPASAVTTDGVDYVIDAGTARSPFTKDVPHYISVGYKR